MGELNCPGRNLGVRGDRARLCDGEDWFLQLDSHHRFVPDRDVLLLDEAARSTSDRPVVATSGTPVLRGRISPRRPPADDHAVHRIQSTRHALVHGEPHWWLGDTDAPSSCAVCVRPLLFRARDFRSRCAKWPWRIPG